MSPPVAIATKQEPALGVNQEVTEFMSTRMLVREARKVVADMNLTIDGSRLRKLIRRFIQEGRADVDFRTWFISYNDPTGETAVRNVMRGSR